MAENEAHGKSIALIIGFDVLFEYIDLDNLILSFGNWNFTTYFFRLKYNFIGFSVLIES